MKLITKTKLQPEVSAIGRKKLLLVVLIMLLVINACLLYFKDDIKYIVRPIISQITASPDVLELDIKFNDLMTLDEDRSRVKQQVASISSENQWVSGELKFNDKKVKIKVRLRGVFSDHWNGEKWSLKIKIKNGNTIKGLKEFSLLVPESREFLLEPIFHEFLKNEGLIFHRMEYVVVKINGEELGIYLLAENASKLLIENNNRREGPLVQFDKTGWIEYFRNNKDLMSSESFKESFAKPANSAEFEKQLSLRNQYNHAIGALDSFKDGKIPLEDIFDVESIAKVAAIYALFGSFEFDWKDLIFFYNTVTSRFEVIGSEVHSAQDIFKYGWWYGGKTNPDQQDFNSLLFKDSSFVNKYFHYLEYYTNELYIEKTFQKLEQFINENLLILHRDYPKYNSPWSLLKRNSLRIQSFIKGQSRIIPYFLNQTDQHIDLKIYSRHWFGIIPLSIINSDGEVIAENQTPMPIKMYDGKNQSINVIRFKIIKPNEYSKLSLHYRVNGTNVGFNNEIKNWIPLVAESNLLPTNDQILNKYFNINKGSMIVSCKSGTTNIIESIVIPKNHVFLCSEKAKIILEKKVSIISLSPIRFIGTNDAKIKIIGNQGAYGFYVIQAGGESVIKHATFEGLGVIEKPDKKITGAVTFYESNVRIENVKFKSNNSGDDNLNIVRSHVFIENVVVENSLFDAIDLDFVSGEIKNLNVNQSGNDGLDLSGSELIIDSINIIDSGDKSISFGERTFASVINASISDAKIGVAIKDDSVIKIENIQLSNVDIGFSAYQKKSEFGGGDLTIKNVKRDGTVKRLSEKDKNSSINWIN